MNIHAKVGSHSSSLVRVLRRKILPKEGDKFLIIYEENIVQVHCYKIEETGVGLTYFLER
jgi:hypothetical protein